MMTNLNITTTLALFGWPFVALWLYKTRPVGQATLWTILGGFLLLPVSASLKLPILTKLDKDTIPALVALLCCIMVARRRVRFSRGFGLAEVFVIAAVIGPIATALLNSDPVVFGVLTVPGVGLYDGASTALAIFIGLIPFFLGRQFLRSSDDVADILRILTIAGLAYSLPVLFEWRMSPMLHTKIYGYFPFDMSGQMFRDGGFRPLVFTRHGLVLAFFMMTTVVAAAALWRTRTRLFRLPPAGIVGYLGTLLVMCKTMSAVLYAALLVPLVRWATPRTQMRVATVLVALVLAYPVLRATNLVPTTFLVETLKPFGAERADSLATRFLNEGELLQHAESRFWFGWGRYGRSRLYDPDSGNDFILADGEWIITLGQFGAVGFLAKFGLLGLSVFSAAWAFRFVKPGRDRVQVAALTLIVAINIFDLLPNSSIGPWTWLLVGGLLGHAEALRAAARRPLPSPATNLEIGGLSPVIGRPARFGNQQTSARPEIAAVRDPVPPR